MESRDVVILGGGPAGRVVVHVLHAARPELSVTLIKDEPENVNRCAGPYGIDGRKEIDVYRIRNTLVTDLGEEARFPGVINASASTAFELSFGSAGVSERAAREAGLDVIPGTSEVLDRYPMMDGKKGICAKLVFERGSGRLLGGSVLRRDHGAAPLVDFLSLAIQMGATLDDLDTHQYATHPELAARPSDNLWTFACRAARKGPG